MEKLKFDNEGCYGIIAKDFTVTSVSRLASAISQWLFKKFKKPSIIIGYDTRFGNEMFVETLIKIFASKGVNVFLSEGFSTSAMISFATMRLNASCGIIVTGRNDHGYKNGIRIFDSNGFLLSEKDLKDIEILTQESFETDADLINLNGLIEQGLINYINLNSLYLKHLNDNFNLKEITVNHQTFIFDVLYGSSQDILKRIFQRSKYLHDKINPIFDNLIPECEYKNFHELAEIIDNSDKADELLGIGLNAEGTKLCLYSKETGFINFQDLILIILYILVKHKNIKEKVILSSFITPRIYKLCEYLNHPVENIKNSLNTSFAIKIEDENKIYFKDKFHFNDAIYIFLLIIEYLTETKTKINELLKEIHSKTGVKYCLTKKISLEKNKILKFTEKLTNNEPITFSNLQINKIDLRDCYVFEVGEETYISFRITSNHQFIEFYIESENENKCESILNEIIEYIKSL